MKSKKELKEIAKRDANRFCRRNRVYETYDGSVADMIKKLYITTYLRARHQIMSEINQKTPGEAFENAKGFQNNLKAMKTESFRYVSNKPNIEEIPYKEDSVQSEEIYATNFVCDEVSRGYKGWDELTPMDKAIYKITGGKLINCYWDNRNASKPMTPVIREVNNQKNRNKNDRITYVVGPEWINVWYLDTIDGLSKIKGMTLRTAAVKNYVNEYFKKERD